MGQVVTMSLPGSACVLTRPLPLTPRKERLYHRRPTPGIADPARGGRGGVLVRDGRGRRAPRARTPRSRRVRQGVGPVPVREPALAVARSEPALHLSRRPTPRGGPARRSDARRV